MTQHTPHERRSLATGLALAILLCTPAPQAQARNPVLKGADWEDARHMVSRWRTDQTHARFPLTRRMTDTRLETQLPPPSRYPGQAFEARVTAWTSFKPKAPVFLHNTSAADGSVTITSEPNPARYSSADYRNVFVVSVKASALRRLTAPKTFHFEAQHGSEKVRLSWEFKPYDGPSELASIRCPERVAGTDSRNFAVDIQFEDPTPRGESMVFRSTTPDALHTAQYAREVVPEYPQLDDFYRFDVGKGQSFHRLVLTLDQDFAGTARLRVMTRAGLMQVERTGTLSGEPYDLQTCEFPVEAAQVKHYEAPAQSKVPRRPLPTGPLQAPANTQVPRKPVR